MNYICEIDGDWLLTEIVSNSGIVRLGINEQGEMYSDGYVFDFGSPSEVDESRKIIDPLLK